MNFIHFTSALTFTGTALMLAIVPACNMDGSTSSLTDQSFHKGQVVSGGVIDSAAWDALCKLQGAGAGCDLCAKLGWYGDKVCDAFCPNPDPDCTAIEPRPESPSGTTVPTASELIDGSGAVWTLVGDQIARDGVIDADSSKVILLLYFGGAVYQETSAIRNGQNCWWYWTSSGWIGPDGVSDPRATPSADGATVPPEAQLVDVSHNVWVITPDQQIAQNGVVQPDTGNVTLLLLYRRDIYQKATSRNLWWQWIAGTWGEMSPIDPRTIQTIAGQPLPIPIPRSLFGMHTHYTYDWPTVPIGGLGKGSCVAWTYVEQTHGTYDWSMNDAYVALAENHGIDIYYALGGTPLWATSDVSSCGDSGCSPDIKTCAAPPANLQDADDFLTAFVTRYKGRVRYYELDNEPYQPNGPNHYILKPADLAVLATHRYNIIRAIDPEAKIITPSMGTNDDYALAYFVAGGPTGVDIASFHAYTDTGNLASDYPEGLMGNYLFDYNYPTPNLTSIISTYLPGKPIWDSEGSGNMDANFPTVEAYAGFIARWHLLHWSNGVSRAYWYAWDDEVFGALMPSMVGSSIPAQAYQEIQNWMVGATMPAPCAWSGASTYKAVYQCPLTRGSTYHAIAVWNTEGNTSLSVAPEYVQYRDLAGSITPVSGGNITIGVRPLLLETGTP